MTDYDYDLFVIGAGSGGVRAARVAAQSGARVAIAEEYRVGGTCVVRGCVPKKLLVYAARFKGLLEDAAGYGWSVPTASFDWAALIAAKDREVDRLSGIYARNLERAGVRLYRSRASLADRHTVRLEADGVAVTARTVLIATGARPVLPDIVGREHLVTSNEALSLASLPASVAILGGGYIALEFATIFAGLGSEVTVVYRGPQILRGFDRDLRDGLHEALVKRGIAICCDSEVASVASAGAGYRLALRDGGSLDAALVLAATGRAPNTGELGLEAAGVAVGGNGDVVVDAYSRSSVDNIYAVGDVTHRFNLTPVAISEAMAFCRTVFAGVPTPVDHAHIPTAVFAEPEVAAVGLSEEAARAACGRVDIYKARFRPMYHTLSGRDETMLMKLTVDGASGRVLGCHMLGAGAAEIVQMAAIAIRMGATKADFDATMALHPTAAEELVTMREKWTPPAA